jgi:methylenetetrahydrofolate dehydrogenase (NADP+)/methenyltetrahydrofolate cyclohydrolase
MAARILDGRGTAHQIETEVAAAVASLRRDRGVAPRLAVVLVGDDAASHVYVRAKARACRRAGIEEETSLLPADVPEGAVLDLIAQLNADEATHGILVQIPLPPHISKGRVLEAMDPRKDVDAFHPVNVGRLVTGAPVFEPCTPSGILELLHRGGYPPAGKHVVVVGRSDVVGRPLVNMLLQKSPSANATVTVCHTGTPDVAAFTRQADIVVAAAGKPEMLHGSMLRPGCVVVDVGVNRVEDSTQDRGYRLVGDVHFASASAVAEAISPVPGGVGPMTIAMLLRNTLRAARRHAGLAEGEAPAATSGQGNG